jgi:hyperosmotically inducible protein
MEIRMTVVINEQPVPSVLPSERRTVSQSPPRRRWTGPLVLTVAVAGVTALAVSSYYDRRSPGEKIDATVQGLRDSATAVVQGSSEVGDRAAAALVDTGITASVKAALAEAGVVSLTGPAPDERARQRAAVLAAAPAGVVRVDNRLVVAPPAATLPR